MEKFTKILSINNNEIQIKGPSLMMPEPYVIDYITEDITWELNINQVSGIVNFNSEIYEWELIEPKSYLEQKVKILEDKGEVVFEHDCMIYTISESIYHGYEINMYDMHVDNFISGDTLDADDGGHCTGNAKDAVYFMIGGQNEHQY